MSYPSLLLTPSISFLISRLSYYCIIGTVRVRYGTRRICLHVEIEEQDRQEQEQEQEQQAGAGSSRQQAHWRLTIS